MASRIEEFDEKILACAKEEFLEKGYTDASIRVIQIKKDYSAFLWNQQLTV